MGQVVGQTKRAPSGPRPALGASERTGHPLSWPGDRPHHHADPSQRPAYSLAGRLRPDRRPDVARSFEGSLSAAIRDTTQGMKRLWAILRLRCPRCLEGKVFQGILRMNPACPQCGLALVREPGYYLGAMYFSYALAILSALPLCLLLFFLEVPPVWNALAGAAQMA